jgi:hypothetical protein
MELDFLEPYCPTLLLPFSLSGWSSENYILTYQFQLHRIQTYIEVSCRFFNSFLFFSFSIGGLYKTSSKIAQLCNKNCRQKKFTKL